jgi:transposase-like protein
VLSDKLGLPLNRLPLWHEKLTERSAFRYFKTGPDILHLAVMLYIRFPLSLCIFEDYLNQRRIKISRYTVRAGSQPPSR